MTTLATSRSGGNGETGVSEANAPAEAPSAGAAAVDLVSRELLALLVRDLEGHRELDPTTLVYHLRQAEATAGDGHWHSAVNEARSFIEGLVVGMAESESRRRNHVISGVTPGAESRLGYHECRKYLVTVGFTGADEMDLFKHVYAIASRKGAHPGVTDEGWGRLVCHLCWTSGYLLLRRYAAWKSHRRRWPDDRRRSGDLCHGRQGPNESWRGWLTGVLRRTAGNGNE